jgi:anti-anti-sigma regulatory factor/anti-sigma regulatory factor (Ser/Thr protein kinase)
LSSQLVCRPEQDLPVAILRVSGVLDLVTGPALQQAVRRSMSVQPEMLLLDFAELQIADAPGLAALSAVVEQTAEWPDLPIVFCGADPATNRMIASARGCTRLGTSPDRAAAMSAAGAKPAQRRFRVRLRPVPDACRQVRQVVNQACAAWQHKEFAATGALIATELVANAVRHARTTMEFTVGLRDNRLSMSVRDGSRRLPRPADPRVSVAGGRGLRLVRDLSDAWGVLPVADGKVVWTHILV